MARLDVMESRINDRFAGIESRLGDVEQRLSTLEATVDDRLHSTRPIWEKALAGILALSEQMTENNHRLAAVQESLEIVGGERLALKGKQRHLETRVRAIEETHQPQ